MPVAFGRLLVHGLPVVIVLVVYLCGCAQMTAANFARVHLRDQLNEIEAQNHLLSGKLIEMNNRTAVDAWAGKNGMVRVMTSYVVAKSENAQAE